MRYVFPAVFIPAEEGGYTVSVPDIEGCFTEGDTLAEAMFMAQDALAMMLAHLEDHDINIPAATSVDRMECPEGGTISLVPADTDLWRRTFDNKAVKKTLSIPSWLNSKALKAGLNFSQVLQEALIDRLG